MKYIIFTFEGNGFPIAERLLEEGQEVLVGQVKDIKDVCTQTEKEAGIDEPKEEQKIRLKIYNNVLKKMSADTLVDVAKKIKDPENYFAFFESNNLFYYADQLKDLGFHGNFPTEEDREFETNRQKAKNFVKKYYPRLSLVPVRSFRKVDRAIKFLEKSHKVWVLKSQTDNIATFVPQTRDIFDGRQQIIEQLKEFRDEYEKSGFLLERKLNDFIEITPEKMYYNGIPLCITMNFENKFFGSGNIGIQVGCAGDLVFPISMKSKIHDIAFPKVVDELAKQHNGLFIWDASILIDKKTGKMYFGEFCSNRAGYNSFFTEIAQAKSVHAFFEDVVAKKNPLPKGTIGASLMLFDMNRNEDDELIADATITIQKSAKPHVWPYSTYKKSKNDVLRTVGYDKHLAPVTGTGKSIDEAVDNLYEYVEGFLLAGLYYRPKFDFLSKDYSSSIVNRLDYCLKKKLFVQ